VGKSESDNPEHRVCTDFYYQKSITTGLSQVRDVAVFRVAWMYYSTDLMIYPEGVSVYKIDFCGGRWIDFVVVPADDRTGWDSGCTTFLHDGGYEQTKLCSERWWIGLVFFTSLCTQARFCSGWRVELLEEFE